MLHDPEPKQLPLDLFFVNDPDWKHTNEYYGSFGLPTHKPLPYERTVRLREPGESPYASSEAFYRALDDISDDIAKRLEREGKEREEKTDTVLRGHADARGAADDPPTPTDSISHLYSGACTPVKRARVIFLKLLGMKREFTIRDSLLAFFRKMEDKRHKVKVNAILAFNYAVWDARTRFFKSHEVPPSYGKSTNWIVRNAVRIWNESVPKKRRILHKYLNAELAAARLAADDCASHDPC